MMTYGHLTFEEIAKEGLAVGAYLHRDGKVYRIREMVPSPTGARYQAEECDPNGPHHQRPPEHESPAPEPVSSARRSDEPAFTLHEGETGPWEKASHEERYPEGAAEEFASIVPPLSVWAKSHGWSGHGRIPNAVRSAYDEAFPGK